VGAAGHGLLQAVQLLLDGHELGGAGEDVVAQREVPLPRRALVVQGDLGVALEDQLALVDGGLAGEHPQQRGLARAVAARQGQAVAPLELERHAAQQRLAGDVLAEVGGDEHGHAVDGKGPIPASGTRGDVPR
jgi:hypothetical protein